ncbi:MAG: hypothetical protein EOO68_17990, partial [Moraxellaceae bacterium]
MKKKSYKLIICIGFFCLAFFAIYFFIHNLRKDSEAPYAHSVLTQNGITYLGQGWGIEERQQVSFTSFGSRIINYAWFLALENAESEQLFRDNSHMASLGFITDSANPFNPDGLPIGISRDSDENGNTWAGLTCAEQDTAV